MNKTFVICVCLFATLFNACSYKWVRTKSSSGRNYWHRKYFDRERQNEYSEKRSFNNIYTLMPIEKYNKDVISDTFNGYTYFQFDSVRIYLNKYYKEYNCILSSGLLYPNQVFCALDSNCKPYSDSSREYLTKLNKDGTIIKPGKAKPMDTSFLRQEYGWIGKRITIKEVYEIKNMKNRNYKKRFRIDVLHFNGGSTHYIFYMEIINKEGKKNMELKDYVKGSTITFFKFVHQFGEI